MTVLLAGPAPPPARIFFGLSFVMQVGVQGKVR